MAQKPPLDPGPIIYQARLDEITFTKKQQWTLTNYLIAIFAGIFAVTRAFDCISIGEKVGFTILVAFSLAYYLCLLRDQQHHLCEIRETVDRIHRTIDGKTREIFSLDPDPSPLVRGSNYVVAFISVSVIGACLVWWTLWRSALLY